MCDFPECNRKKNTLDDRPASKDPLFNENPETDSRARRPEPNRPSVRPGTISGGMYRHAADEDTDGSECEASIDELEYMRLFFH